MIEAATDPVRPPTASVDGRHAWRERNRLAVVDALLDIYAEGNLKPGAQEVAERSGVSRRSVFRYFEDLDDLDRTAIQRQQDRVRHLIELPGLGEGSLEERVERIARQRMDLFEAVRPAARVARVRAPFYHVIAEQLAESRQFLGHQVERQFMSELNQMPPERRCSVLAASDALCSFETFDLLTASRGMTRDEVCATVAFALKALFSAR